MNMLLDPLEGKALVEKACIGFHTRTIHPTKETETVINRHEDHSSAAKLLTARYQAVASTGVILVAENEPSTVDPNKDWGKRATPCLPDVLRQ